MSKEQNLQRALTYMLRARSLDMIEQEYTARGEAFFHVSSGGHEGIAVIDSFIERQDWIHAHYRDKALLLSHGVKTYDYLLALFNKDAAHSRGRQMNAHMSSRENHIFSLVGPVGNSQLQAAGAAAAVENNPDKPIVLSLVGDGTTAQGEFLEGLTLTIRDNLPVVTIIENNNFAISTCNKGKTFFNIRDREIDNFLGCPIHRIDGRKPHDAYDAFEKIIATTRKERVPSITIFTVERLDSHTNADDHRVYRTAEEIAEIRTKHDPIIYLMKYLYNEDDESAHKRLRDETTRIIEELRPEVKKAQHAAEPKPIFTAKAELPNVVTELAKEEYEEGDLTMISSIRSVLDKWLKQDERVFLYGEDIEDPKGDVFGLTKGLSTTYPGRVVNSPLSESLILGSSVGRALVGQKPVAFLQFADFIPLITNQLYSDVGSMWWRSDGSWNLPLIVMATTGGYKPGLGPFHASSFEALVGHIPGIDVFAPSNAADAAGLLNTAFLSERPTVFFYPKNLLNNRVKNITDESARAHVIMPGKARIVEEGQDITLVGYGNTVNLCEKAAETLKKFGKTAEVIDLRTISPLDHNTVIESVKKTRHLLVVHEENGSMGVGSELLARVVEVLNDGKMRRVTRRDTYVPCNFVNQLEVLPSYKKIVNEAVDLLDGEIEWIMDEEVEDGVTAIEAVGASPSDETFTIIEWKIEKGQTIHAGDLIAEAEANKADVTVKSVVSGTVKDILVEEGDTVDIGSTIALIQTEDKIFKTVTKEVTGTPHITWGATSIQQSSTDKNIDIYIGYHSSVLGSNVVDNKKLVEMSPEWNEESIIASTGIETRHWIGDDQSIVSMPADAARNTLKQAGLKITDITGIICATGTSEFHTPSLATRVQYELVQDLEDGEAKENYKGFAYDVSAACSGFVYALNNAYNRLKVNPKEKILILTAEVLSHFINIHDYQTAPIFADAGCACIVSTEKMPNAGKMKLPVLEAIGEPATSLTVPSNGFIGMDGIEVYKVAVAHLKYIAEIICKANNTHLHEIDLIVPHQANLKIIKGVARRLKVDIDKFYININRHGNTSSCTIPICLGELHEDFENTLKDKKVMYIAFGGGYTFGATIVEY